MDVSGRWEGKLLDASGPVARVTAVLKQAGERVTGEFSVYVASARDGCGCSGWKLAQTAPVAGTFASSGQTLQLKYEQAVGAKPSGVVFEARLRDADPHARQALIGSYTVSDDARQIGFEGGACVLWSFRK